MKTHKSETIVLFHTRANVVREPGAISEVSTQRMSQVVVLADTIQQRDQALSGGHSRQSQYYSDKWKMSTNLAARSIQAFQTGVHRTRRGQSQQILLRRKWIAVGCNLAAISYPIHAPALEFRGNRLDEHRHGFCHSTQVDQKIYQIMKKKVWRTTLKLVISSNHSSDCANGRTRRIRETNSKNEDSSGWYFLERIKVHTWTRSQNR